MSHELPLGCQCRRCKLFCLFFARRMIVRRVLSRPSVACGCDQLRLTRTPRVWRGDTLVVGAPPPRGERASSLAVFGAGCARARNGFRTERFKSCSPVLYRFARASGFAEGGPVTCDSGFHPRSREHRLATVRVMHRNSSCQVAEQVAIPFRAAWGGARLGAGRPKGTRRSGRMPHARRPRVSKHRPRHVTVRVAR